MAKAEHSPRGDEDNLTTPRKRRVKTLPATPETTIYYPNPDVAVVVSRRAGASGAGSLGATIDVCKCTKTEFKCTKGSTGNVICKEECVEWDCTTIKTTMQ